MAQAGLDNSLSAFSEKSLKAFRRAKVLIAAARAAGLDQVETGVVVDEAAEVLFRCAGASLLDRTPEERCMARFAKDIRRVAAAIFALPSWEGDNPLDQLLLQHADVGALVDGRV